jgi:vacuolar-type H+-ATPase subunit H
MSPRRKAKARRKALKASRERKEAAAAMGDGWLRARRKAPTASAEAIAEEAQRMAECQAEGMRAREQALVSVLSEIVRKMPPLSDEARIRIAELISGDIHAV